MTKKRFMVSKIMPMWVNDEKTNYCYCLTTREDANHLCDLLKELHEENEQLKEGNQRLIKMLDNVANYIQKEHRCMPIDDFVEWWNNIETEGLK